MKNAEIKEKFERYLKKRLMKPCFWKNVNYEIKDISISDEYLYADVQLRDLILFPEDLKPLYVSYIKARASRCFELSILVKVAEFVALKEA